MQWIPKVSENDFSIYCIAITNTAFICAIFFFFWQVHCTYLKKKN